MMAKVAKGAKDYGPEEMRARVTVLQNVRRVFQRHGAVEMDTPVFELKSTLVGRYGEDEKLIYDIADQGGELLALRYDLTVPLARYMATHGVTKIKRYQIGKVYRRDNPNTKSGRMREFCQCDFDIAGARPAASDAEIIGVACEALQITGIEKFIVHLNHRGLLSALMLASGVPLDMHARTCASIDKIDKLGWEGVSRELTETRGLSEDVVSTLQKFIQRTGTPQEILEYLMGDAAFADHVDAVQDVTSIVQCLQAMDLLRYLRVDLSLARGLDYYTGFIFEVEACDYPHVGSIAAGGRYDNMTSSPCCGVSIGLERVMAVLSHIPVPPDKTMRCYVASVGDVPLAHRLQVAQMLWNADIATDYSDKERPKMAHQMKEALKRHIPFVVVIGEDELNSGTVQVKDMEACVQKSVELEKLVQYMSQALK